MTAFFISVDRSLQGRGIQIKYSTAGRLHNLARLKCQKNMKGSFIFELQHTDSAMILGYSSEETQRMVNIFVENHVLELEISDNMD